MTKPIELTETYTPRNSFSASSLLSSIMKESQNEKIDGTLNIATVFSGIGTPEYSLNRGGWKHKVIFACERDKYARETYELNYGKPNTFYNDIVTLKAKKYLGLIDCLFGGSPCQSFSIAGKRGGLDDTRGTLFYEYARVLKECEAETFVYENVKGMVNHDKPKVCQFELNTLKNINYYSWKPFKLQFKLSSKKYTNLNKEALKTKKGVVWEGAYFKEGYPSLVNSEYDGKKKGIGKTLHIVENTFKELGYSFTWTILNTKEHGVPQNRERIYIVGFRNAKEFKKFKFQKPFELKTRLMDILEDEVAIKYHLSKGSIDYMNKKRNGKTRWNYHKNELEGVASCLTACMWKGIPYGIIEPHSKIKMIQTHTYNIKAAESCKRIYSACGVSPTLTTMGGGHREPKVSIYKKIKKVDDKYILSDKLIKGFGTHNKVHSKKGTGFIWKPRDIDGYASCLRANASLCPTDNTIQIDDFIFRKLTPRECFRLQGFDDDFKFNVSDTQAYKQAGNSMSANVTDFILNDICNILGINKH